MAIIYLPRHCMRESPDVRRRKETGETRRSNKWPVGNDVETDEHSAEHQGVRKRLKCCLLADEEKL